MKKTMRKICCLILTMLMVINSQTCLLFAANYEATAQLSSNSNKKTIRRALILGETSTKAIPQANVTEIAKLMKNCTFDGEKMKGVVKKINISKQEISDVLKETFKYTKDSDISYIYITCHGTQATKDQKQKIKIDKQRVGYTPKELRQLLEKNIKGKIVILLDCCYSGMIIQKSIGIQKYTENTTANMAEEFIQEFVGNTITANRMLQMQSVLSNAENRFYILCSSRYNEASFGKMPDSKFSLATKYWLLGGGWNQQMDKGLSMKADKNKDKRVTLFELYSYSAPKILKETSDYNVNGKKVTQNICIYPQKTNTIIFGKY